MTFKRALGLLPDCLADGLDLTGQHKTVADLRFMAQHELDLANEGDIELTLRNRSAIERFLRHTGVGNE
jgi:hypothetical protein